MFSVADRYSIHAQIDKPACQIQHAGSDTDSELNLTLPSQRGAQALSNSDPNKTDALIREGFPSWTEARSEK